MHKVIPGVSQRPSPSRPPHDNVFDRTRFYAIHNMSDDPDEDIMSCGANTEIQLLRACSLVGESRSNAAIFDM